MRTRRFPHRVQTVYRLIANYHALVFDAIFPNKFHSTIIILGNKYNFEAFSVALFNNTAYTLHTHTHTSKRLLTYSGSGMAKKSRLLACARLNFSNVYLFSFFFFEIAIQRCQFNGEKIAKSYRRSGGCHVKAIFQRRRLYNAKFDFP